MTKQLLPLCSLYLSLASFAPAFAQEYAKNGFYGDLAPMSVVNSSHMGMTSKAICNIKLEVLKVRNNVKVRVISAPLAKLDLQKFQEFEDIPAPAQSFIGNAIENKLVGVKTEKAKKVSVQNASEELILFNASKGNYDLGQVGPGVSLSYNLKGGEAEMKARKLGKGSKLYIAADLAISGRIVITEAEDDSEIFIVHLSKGDNGGCVSVAGDPSLIRKKEDRSRKFNSRNTDVAFYIQGESAKSTKGSLQVITGPESKVVQRVIGGDDTLSSSQFSGQIAQIKVQAGGGANTRAGYQSALDGDDNEDGNKVKFDVLGGLNTLVGIQTIDYATTSDMSVTGGDNTGTSLQGNGADIAMTLKQSGGKLTQLSSQMLSERGHIDIIQIATGNALYENQDEFKSGSFSLKQTANYAQASIGSDYAKSEVDFVQVAQDSLLFGVIELVNSPLRMEFEGSNSAKADIAGFRTGSRDKASSITGRISSANPQVFKGRNFRYDKILNMSIEKK